MLCALDRVWCKSISCWNVYLQDPKSAIREVDDGFEGKFE
jgi:hypothetical protein